MRITLNKIGSVTKNVELTKRVDISPNIECKEGAILAARVLEDTELYNQLELPSGRMSTMHKGDIIAVALGNRYALHGFAGVVPKKLAPKDVIHILSLGGVSGQCIGENLQRVGHALKIRVIGAITRNGKNLNTYQFPEYEKENSINKTPPLIFVSGTCMNSGKTRACCEIIKRASRNKLKVAAGKVSGVAALKDTEDMLDYGARNITSFLDCGCPSTAKIGKKVLPIAKGAIAHLAKTNPDVIILELGDGIYGEYGTMEILKDKEIQKNTVVHIGCAQDPLGAAKLIEASKEIGLPITAMSGPITDNEVGLEFLRKKLRTTGINAINNSKELFAFIEPKLKNRTK